MSKKNRDVSRKVREMQAAQRAADQRRRSMIIGGVVVVVVALVVGIGIAVQSQRNSAEPLTAAGTPQHAFEKFGVLSGQESAPVTVTVFEDFQCPVCKQFEESVGSFVSDEVDAGSIKVIYRPMAFLDRMSSTDYSSRALETAACTLDQTDAETFLTLHAALFAQQPAEETAGLSDEELAGIAETAGADKATIEKCQADDTFANWVKAATEQASKDGVSGTPTIEVNGDTVSLPSDPNDWQQTVKDAIDSAA